MREKILPNYNLHWTQSLILITIFLVGSFPRSVIARSATPPNDLFGRGKYIQRINLITGDRYVKDLTKISAPEPVRRLRLLIGTAQALSSSKYVDVFRLRLRWIDPEFWNDNWVNVTQRAYDINCEIEDKNTGVKFTFLEMRIDSTLTGFDENFLIRDRMPLLIRCQIRAFNSYNIASSWRKSSTIKLYRLYSQPRNNEDSSPTLSNILQPPSVPDNNLSQ